jgi:hypothetical protein
MLVDDEMADDAGKMVCESGSAGPLVGSTALKVAGKMVRVSGSGA